MPSAHFPQQLLPNNVKMGVGVLTLFLATLSSSSLIYQSLSSCTFSIIQLWINLSRFLISLLTLSLLHLTWYLFSLDDTRSLKSDSFPCGRSRNESHGDSWGQRTRMNLCSAPLFFCVCFFEVATLWFYHFFLFLSLNSVESQGVLPPLAMVLMASS